MLLERWQKPKTTGALAERWPGGRKKVSDSVPIFFLIGGCVMYFRILLLNWHHKISIQLAGS